MFGIASLGPVIEIDGAPSAFSPLVIYLRVALMSGAPGDSAEIEILDDAGNVTLPPSNADLRIALQQPGGASDEIFRGRVTGVTALGSGSGRRLVISAIAGRRTRRPRPAAATLICRAGRNLIAWSLPARLVGPGGGAPAGNAGFTLKLTAEPQLHPGDIVTIGGTRVESDGDYRVAAVTHQFSVDGGWSTEVSVRRSTA